MPHSQAIGAAHEARLRNLLTGWGIPFETKKKVRTAQDGTLELDFWIPPSEERPQIAIECKTFGVDAKSPADSSRRKTQEALWLLIQLRRHCAATQDARLVLVAGQRAFTDAQAALLRAELGPSFFIVSADEPEQLHRILRLPDHNNPASPAEKCPICRSLLTTQANARDLGDTATSYSACKRICLSCEIGLTNAKRPTFIRRDWRDGLWRRSTASRLLCIIANSLNDAARETKVQRLAHERSEDLLTWNIFSWLEDSSLLPHIFPLVGLPTTSEGIRILYWGANDRYSMQYDLRQLLVEDFGESPSALSEPDVILMSDAAVVVIEAKFDSPNDQKAGRNVSRYVDRFPAWFKDQHLVEQAAYYELTRNWAIGAAIAERSSKKFALVNLVRGDEENEIERTFGHVITDRGAFKRLSWEVLAGAVEPGLLSHMRDETLYFQSAFQSLSVQR